MKWKVALLVAVGLFQMTGDLLHLPFLKKAGAASGASPAPKVFCAIDGYEAYATRFLLEWEDDDGATQSLPISAETVGRLRGPYNRRNVYGAALAYGPVLPERLSRPTLHYGLTGDAPVLREIGLQRDGMNDVRVRYESLREKARP